MTDHSFIPPSGAEIMKGLAIARFVVWCIAMAVCIANIGFAWSTLRSDEETTREDYARQWKADHSDHNWYPDLDPAATANGGLPVAGYR